jgi:flagellum-specific ATP synthase
LISVGAYESGSDANIDLAIKAMPELEAFLRQEMRTPVNLKQSIGQLMALFSGTGQ